WNEQTLADEAHSHLMAGMADASVDNIAFAANVIDGSASVTDSFGGSLGTASFTDASPVSYHYSHTFEGDAAGTCTDHDNVATFVTNSSGASNSASQSVRVCVGRNLTVSKTAAASYTRTYSWSV